MNSDESERNREVNEISQRPTEPVPHLPIGNQAYKAFFDAFKAWESHKGRSSTDTSPMYSIEVTADHLPNNPDLRGTAVFGADQAYKVWIIVKVWNIPDNKTRYVTIAERTQIENGQHGQYVVSTAATAGDGPNCNKLAAHLWNHIHEMMNSNDPNFPKEDRTGNIMLDWSYYTHPYWAYKLNRFNA